jgi:hypothetical protein
MPEQSELKAETNYWQEGMEQSSSTSFFGSIIAEFSSSRIQSDRLAWSDHNRLRASNPANASFSLPGVELLALIFHSSNQTSMPDSVRCSSD